MQSTHGPTKFSSVAPEETFEKKVSLLFSDFQILRSNFLMFCPAFKVGFFGRSHSHTRCYDMDVDESDIIIRFAFISYVAVFVDQTEDST